MLYFNSFNCTGNGVKLATLHCGKQWVNQECCPEPFDKGRLKNIYIMCTIYTHYEQYRRYVILKCYFEHSQKERNDCAGIKLTSLSSCSRETSFFYIICPAVWPTVHNLLRVTAFANTISSVSLFDLSISFIIMKRFSPDPSLCLCSAGSSYYDNVRPLAYPDCDAVLICFDISRPETLDSIPKKVRISFPFLSSFLSS